jgi:hypothetical protein
MLALARADAEEAGAAGGRVGASDIVVEDRLSPGERAERGSYVGCIAARSRRPTRRG